MDEEFNNGVPDFIKLGHQKVQAQKAKQRMEDENLRPIDRLRKQRLDAVKKQNNTNPLERTDVDYDRMTFGAGKQAEEDYIDNKRMLDSAPYMSRDTNNTDYGQYDETGRLINDTSAFDGAFVDEVATSFKRGVGKHLLGGTGDMINMIYSAVGSGLTNLIDYDNEKINFNSEFSKNLGEGNALSNFLKQEGQAIENENQSYLPEELRNPTLSFSTFLNPKFWSYHGGEFLPQLAEIVVSYGAGSLAKKGVQKGMRTAFKDAIEEGAKRGAIREGTEVVSTKTGRELAEEVTDEAVKRGWANKSSVFGTVRQATDEAFSSAGRRAGIINEIKNTGSGVLGKTLTSKGTLTKNFGDLVQTVGAGMYTNLSVGLKNGAELYNTYKGMTHMDENGNPVLDENGNPVPMFTDEELGGMARDAFVNNMAYMGVDILSWGMTYGKGFEALKKIPTNLSKKLGINAIKGAEKGIASQIAGAAASETGKSIKREMVSRILAPVFKKAGKLGQKMVLEGAEESVQETFEEWSKMKAYADKNGSLEGYAGLSRDYDTKSGIGIFSGGFWDYYMSKDSEGIRAISAALGAVAGGAFNLRSVINGEADNIHKLGERFDQINQIHTTNEGKSLQRTNIYRQMAELVMENKGGVFAEMIDGLYNDGKITEAEFKQYGNVYNEVAANYDGIKDMKMKNQKTFMVSVADEVNYRDKLVEAEERYEKNLEVMESAFAQHLEAAATPEEKRYVMKDLEKKRAELEREHKSVTIPLKRLILIEKERQRNLLGNKKAEPVNVKAKTDDNNDVTYAVGPAKKIYNAEFMTDEEVENNERWAPKSRMIEGQKQIGTTAVGPALGKPSENLNMQPAIEGGAIKQLEQTVDQQTSETGQVNPQDPNPEESLDQENLETENNPETNLEDDEEIQDAIEITDYKNFSEAHAQMKDGDTVKATFETGDANAENAPAEYIKEGEYLVPIEDKDKTTLTFDKTKSKRRFKPTDLDANNKATRVFSEKQPTKKSEKKIQTTQEADHERKVSNIAKRNLRKEKLSKSDQEFYDANKDAVDEQAGDLVNSFQKAVENDPEYSDMSKDELDELWDFWIETEADPNEIEDAKVESNEKIEVDEIEDDIFGDSMLKKEESKQEKNRKKNGVANKAKDVLKKTGEKLKGKLAKTKDFIDDDFGTADFVTLSQSIQISNALKTLYPDSNINVYAVKDMKAVFGQRSLGLALAGQIYISEDNWNQGSTFFHEVSHIYYQLTKDSPETQAIVSDILKNKKLAERIYSDYDDFIQYRDKTTGEKVYKRELVGKNYDQVSQEVRDAAIMKRIEAGEIETLPLEEQDVIVEEMFTTTMEGPLSDKYNMYFEEYPRKHQLKRMRMNWLDRLRDRGRAMQLADRKQFYDSLKPEDQEVWTDNLSTIMDSFAKETKGTVFSPEERYARRSKMDQETMSRLEVIERETEAQRKAFINGDLTMQRIKNENAEQLLDTIEFETLFDESDRLAYTNKLMDVILDFSRKYNKMVTTRKAYSKDARKWENADDYNSAERLRYFLSAIAGNSENASDFIDKLENSPINEIKRFMNYLNKSKRGDRNLMLQTLWWHEDNISDINSFKIFVDENQNSTIENNLNNTEQTFLENFIQDLFTLFSRSRSSIKGGDDRYNVLMESARNIYNKNYTNADIENVVRFFVGRPGFDVEQLLAENRININGKVQPLDSAIVKFVNDTNGLLGDKYLNNPFTTNVNGVPIFGIYNENGLKPGFRSMMRALINENRKYTSRFTVRHADGNLHQSRIVDNYLSRGIKRMKGDALEMGINQFLNKYSHLNRGKAGSNSNQFLRYFYNKMRTTGDIDLMEYGGIENAYNDDKSTSMKSSDIVTERLGQFMTFLNTASKSSYLMELGRFSDSSRSYYMESPRIDTNEVISITKDSNGKYVMRFKDRAFLNNIYNTHVSLGYTGSLSDLNNQILESIQDQIDFINNNLSGIQNDKRLSNRINNGRLNAEGQMLVANYEINQIINGTNFTEVFFPSFKMKNENGENMLIKRAKAASSPMFSFKENLKLEPIFINDIRMNIPGNKNFKATDAGFYILEEDAEKFRSAGGTIMPLNNAFKLLHTGIETVNKNVVEPNIYNKGYATILNEEEVRQNPQLRGAYELLKARKQKYESAFGKSSMNLLDGTDNYVPMVIPQSANKVENNLPSFYNLDVMNYETLTQMFNNGNIDEALNILDRMNYEGDKFIGLSGENFGIQQVMDIDKDYANTSVQFIKSLTTNMQFIDDGGVVSDIMNQLTDTLESQIEEAYNMITTGTSEQIREFFNTMVDKEKMDQKQRAVIFDDGVSLTTPYARQIVKETLSNYIKQNGLKLKTPGNILREKPSLYAKPNGWKTTSDMDGTTGNNGLNFYQRNSNGTISKGEVIIPESMIDDGTINTTGKKHRIRARQYFADTNLNPENNLILAKKAAGSDRKIGKVFDENDNHIGYYVEGDTILATRIPSHGAPSTGVFEVIDFSAEAGNNIQLPHEFKNIIGSDNDGDQIFVQHKGRGFDQWNSILDKIEKHYTSDYMWDELHTPIEYEEDVENALNAVEKIYGKQNEKFILPFSSKGRQQAFKDTMIAKANVGTAANFHTTLRMFANYGVGINTPIIIDGQYADQFTDSQSESASIKSAKIFNIILDNSKYGHADRLNINSSTIAMTMILSNLNFDLDKIAVILNHPMIKRYGELNDNNVNIFNKDEKTKVMDQLRREFNLPDARQGFSSVEFETDNVSSNDMFNFISLINGMENEISDVTKVLSIHNTMTVNPFEINSIIEKFDHRMTVENGALEMRDGKIVKEKTNLNFKNLTGENEFAKNPIVQNYKSVLQKNLDIQKRIDPVYSGQLNDLYHEVISLSTKQTFSNDNHKSLLRALELFHTSQILGVNQQFEKDYFRKLVQDEIQVNNVKVENPDSIFVKLGNLMQKMSFTPVRINQENRLRSVTQMDESILFNKGINVSLKGNKYISINNDFHENMMDAEIRNLMLEEWKALPSDIKRDLMMYDLMKTGWTGNLSLFPLFQMGWKMEISNRSGMRTNNSESELNILKNMIIKNNHQLFQKYDNIFKYDKNGNRSINPNISQLNRSFAYELSKGNPFIFKTQGADGKDVLVKFNGFTDNEMVEFGVKMRDDSEFYVKEFLPAAVAKMERNYPIRKNQNASIDYITISDVKRPRKPDQPSSNGNVNSTFTDGLNNSSQGGSIIDDLNNLFMLGRQKRDSDFQYNSFDAKRYDEPSPGFFTKSAQRDMAMFIKDTGAKKVHFKKLLKDLRPGVFHESFKKFQKYVPRDVEYMVMDEEKYANDYFAYKGFYAHTVGAKPHVVIAPFEVDIFEETRTPSSTDTLFHEQIHAVLMSSLHTESKNFDKKFYDDMYDLFEVALDEVKKLENENPSHEFLNGDPFNIYGFSNIQEFVTMSMTHPDFVKFLSKIPSRKNVKNNLFQDIISTVEKFFNIKIGKSLATDVLSVIGQKVESMPTYDQKQKKINEFLTQPTIEPEEDFTFDMRHQRRDYYNFAEKMDRDRFEYVMEFPHQIDAVKRDFFYENYLKDFAQAEELSKKINADTVKDMTDEELIALYEADEIPAKFGGGIGLGRRGKFAYAQVVNPVIKELANRGALEQSKLTGREYDGNDISTIKKFFMSNNVPSNHPAVQFIVRRMETEYKTFLEERSKVVSKINDATNELYEEQLGYSPGKQTFRNILKNIQTALFADKEALYKKLYGPLIEYQETKLDDGTVRMDMKYKPKNVIQREFAEGKISPAQMNFYKVTREISEEMKQYHLKDGKGRMDYIPHSAPANFEILSRRGFLGLMVNAKTIDEKLGDVRMDFKNPTTGEVMKSVPYKFIKDVYNALSKDPAQRNIQNSVDFIRLKKKAISLNRKGVNEDGTPIRQSEVEMGTALGDTFMHSFSNSRSVNSTDLPTLDLNKAFTDYAHATLFQFGNDKFAGFRKMLPIVDGVLAMGSERGDKNITEYVDKIWKQYFLSGTKQSLATKYTPAYLEAVGFTTDKVIDFITKGSLVYWLGWKGLAVGGGLYAVGNILAGKFQNIVHNGGREWLTGEKRFWFGKSGKFDVTDPFKGVRESLHILKKAGFMDINIYDDVNIENKNSIEKLFMNLALMPMAWSEKWIQGVQFLGNLNDEEWENIRNEGPVDKQWLTEKEDLIKQAHGRGYTPTDQRMLQMYSWGRAMLQFNRYIPTMFNTMFGKEDIDIYGKKTMGTYTAVYKTIQNGIRGNWTPRKFSEYYKTLDVEEQKKFKAGLMSIGAVSLLAAINSFTNSGTIDKLISDSHMVLDTDRLSGRLVPRSYLAMEDIFR